MDKWRIIGAEAATGEERSIEVNARDEPAARDAARMLGLLVASAQRLDPPAGPVLDYRTPGLTNRPASVPLADSTSPDGASPAARPSHPAILHGAAAAIALSKVLYALAILLFLASLTGAIATAASALTPAAAATPTAIPDPTPPISLPTLLLATFAATAAALTSLTAAVTLQLLASTALALRTLTTRPPSQ